MYKNIEKNVKLKLADQVEYRPGQVVSKTLVQNDKISVTLFSFDKGEEISTHASGGDAMVTVLDGTGRFTIGERRSCWKQARPSSCRREFPTPFSVKNSSRCC